MLARNLHRTTIRDRLGTAAILLAVLALGWVASGRRASAQGPSLTKQPAERLLREQVDTRLKQVDAAADLDDATKAKIRQIYQQALADLDDATQRAEHTAQMLRTAQTASEELERTRAKLSAMAGVEKAAPPPGATRPELEQELTRIKADLAKAKEKLAGLEAEPKRRAGRRNEVPAELAAATARLDEVVKQLAAATAAGAQTPLAQAQRGQLVARRGALEEEIAGLKQELATYEATAELLPVQRDLAAAEVARLEGEVKRWEEALARRLQEDAMRDARRAKIEAAEAHPLVQPLAEENRRLTEKSAGIVNQYKQVADQLQQAQQTLDDLKKQFTRTRERVEAVGRTNAIGLLLRKQRASLPDRSEYERAIDARQSLIRDIKLEAFEQQDRRSELARMDREVQRVVDELDIPGDEMDRQQWETAASELLEAQRDHLDALIRNYDSYFEALVALDNAQQQLIRQVDEYSNYVGERVLWIRSTSLPGSATPGRVAAAVSWLASPQNWSSVGDVLHADLQRQPTLVAFSLLVFIFMLYQQRRMRNQVHQIGELVEQKNFCRFLPTLRAAVLTVLIALLWPAVLWFHQWRLVTSPESSEFVRAVATGLGRTAWYFLPLELFRQVCRPGGLAEAHFGWPEGSLRVLRRNLRWFLLVSLPLVFLSATLQAQTDERLENSLGRLTYVALMLAVALFCHRVLRPDGDFFRHLLAEGRDRWFYRFRHLWYAVGIAAPLSLAILALAGYFYTAAQLSFRLRETIYVPLGLAILGGILSRGVLVARRRMAMERARARRAAVAQAEAAGPEGGTIAAIAPTAEAEVDLAHVSTQIRRLLESFLVLTSLVAIWFIWVDVAPALAILDRIPIWPTTVQVTESTTAVDGSITVKTMERPDSVSVADLMMAILILLMTFIATHNIPGLLQIAIPQRLPIDAGARYAISTVTRYTLTVIGLALAFSSLGLGWAKIQWLVAAVSVGLGFGLQEIFANFVSGLILLFERPIRIGDIVTVGDVDGVVSRIQIRATTITNWDRKDLIVPNKEFITGRLLNWTLSNSVNRVVINVGIAYGSDTALARQLLEKVVTENEYIMDDPAPMITFEGFGASSLDFVVRAYLPNLEHRLETIHQLHMAIDQTFRTAGIEIAFPQQDVHIRSMPDRLPAVPVTTPGNGQHSTTEKQETK